MFKSFRTKLFIIFMLTTVGISSISLYFLYRIGIEEQLDGVRKTVMGIATTTSLMLDPESVKKINPEKIVIDEFTNNMNFILHKVVENNKDIVYVYVLSETGDPNTCKFIIASDDYGKEKIDPNETYYDVSEIPEVKDKIAFKRPVATEKFYEDEWGKFITGYSPIKDINGNTIGIVGVDMALSRITEFQNEVKKQAILVLIANIIISFILSLIISALISLPLKTIAAHTKLISEGDFNSKLEIKSNDEIRVLADSFNSMTDRLANLFSNLNQTQKQLLVYMEELKQSNNQLNRRISELTLLYDISQAVNQTDDVDELLIIILDGILRGLSSEKGSIMLIDEESGCLVLRAFKDEFIIEKSKRPKIMKVGEGIAGEVALTGKPIIANQGYKDPKFKVREGEKADYHVKNILCVPMIINEKVIGVVNVTNKRKDKDYDEDDLGLLNTLATHIAVIIERARLHELAIIDGLTQVYIHRYFQIRLDEELLRSKRYGYQFSLIMFDIDFFKKFNDTYGHQQGDIVLIEVGKILKQNVRANVDIPARYGGEEFAVILPLQSSHEAKFLAERLRSRIEKYEFPGQTEPLHVTISIGIGSYPSDGLDKNQLIYNTDQALYFSKENGRNQIWTVQEMEKKKKEIKESENGVKGEQ